MALTCIPRRPVLSSGVRPNPPYVLNPYHPLVRGLFGCWPVVSGTGKAMLQNLVPERAPFTYPNFSGDAVPAPNRFGGYCTGTSGQANIQITNINPRIDASSTGPGITLAGWCFQRAAGITTNVPMVLGDGTRQYQLFMRNAGNTARWTNATDALDGTLATISNWVHVCGTMDGSVMNLYINGQLSATKAAITGVALSAGDRITLGLGSSGSFGYYCQYMIWIRALSPTEVFSLYDPDTRWGFYQQTPRLYPLPTGTTRAGHQQFLPLLGVA